MSAIYCDEHGNTGQRLLDPEQPVFALAATDYSAAEATELLEHVRSQTADEVKFKTLRKTPAGRARLARLLTDPRLNPTRVTAFSMDKRYMVVTKLVDLIMETVLNRMGVDLYERGANLATANMIYTCAPVLSGEQEFDSMLEAFVDLARFRGLAHVTAYLDAGARLLQACHDKEMRGFLAGFFDPELVPVWLPSLPEHILDPAIPALFVLIDAWGKRKQERFSVVHDQSKTIVESVSYFESMMARANEQSALVGYDRRKFLFPLRATGLAMGDSKTYPQLQIADICAGATAHFMTCRLTGKQDPLMDLLEQSMCIEWSIDGLFGTADVTPEALGTDGGGGSNPVDPLALRARAGK